MANVDDENRPLILLTGGSGYVGGRLIPLLEKQGGEAALPGPQPGEDAAPCAARHRDRPG